MTDDRQGLSRRELLMLSAVGGLGAMGLTSALDADGHSGQLTAGSMALSQAFNVAQDFWIGPNSAKSNVTADSGRVYWASDTGGVFYGDGGAWVKFDADLASLTTEDLKNADGDERYGDWSVFVAKDVGASEYFSIDRWGKRLKRSSDAHAVIQDAIEHVYASGTNAYSEQKGGVVKLGPWKYTVGDAIQLLASVELRGEGGRDATSGQKTTIVSDGSLSSGTGFSRPALVHAINSNDDTDAYSYGTASTGEDARIRHIGLHGTNADDNIDLLRMEAIGNIVEDIELRTANGHGLVTDGDRSTYREIRTRTVGSAAEGTRPYQIGGNSQMLYDLVHRGAITTDPPDPLVQFDGVRCKWFGGRIGSPANGGDTVSASQKGTAIYGVTVTNNTDGTGFNADGEASFYGCTADNCARGFDLRSGAMAIGCESLKNTGNSGVFVGGGSGNAGEWRAGQVVDAARECIRMGAGGVVAGGRIDGKNNASRLIDCFDNSCVIRDVAEMVNTSSVVFNRAGSATIRGVVDFVTENGGEADFTGDGSTSTFTIAHGLDVTPDTVMLTQKAVTAAGEDIVDYDADGTNITVNFTANLTDTETGTVGWKAEAHI